MSETYQAVYDAARSRIHGGNVTEALENACRDAFGDFHHVLKQAIWDVKNENIDAARSTLRPSVLHRPSICLDGNKWCALYGSNIMEGVCGFGDSPEEAMADFDKNWRTKIA